MPDVTLEVLASVAEAAGREACKRWREELQIWEKSPGNKVCDADLLIDDFLREKLGELDPEAGYLSEESVDDKQRLGCDRVWIVDPIDGTRDFIRERKGWCVSIVLVDRGRPILGVLDAPARGERWTAERGKGAWLDGRPIHVAERTELAGARIPFANLPKNSDLVAVEQPNSIALRIAMVGAGEADLVATLRWGHEWDVGAAVLIAEEAGATVTDALGAPLTFNTHQAEAFGVLVATPGIYEAALARLAERAAEARAR